MTAHYLTAPGLLDYLTGAERFLNDAAAGVGGIGSDAVPVLQKIASLTRRLADRATECADYRKAAVVAASGRPPPNDDLRKRASDAHVAAAVVEHGWATMAHATPHAQFRKNLGLL